MTQTKQFSKTSHLFDLNEKIILNILKIYRSNSFYEDYLQEGRVALIDAIKTYEADKGAQLSTYAYNKIRYQILNFRKKNLSILKTGTTKKDREDKNYNPTVKSYDKETNQHLMPKSNKTNIINIVDQNNNILILKKAFKVLTEKEKDIITKKIQKELTFEKIAKIYKVSKAAIHKAYKKAIEKMRLYFSKIELGLST